MSDSVSAISTLPPLIFASVLSAYGLYLCKENITRLQQYEKASEEAAEWSNTAAQRLNKTRSTQTSGTLSLALSFLAATTLPFLCSKHTSTFLSITGLALGAGLYTARTHMANFWNESKQTKIPFVEKFNDAIRGSERVVAILETLAFSWGVAGCVWALDWELLGVGIWGGVTAARSVWMVKHGAV
ncbi:uncharacterized protein M421DRAFT_77318 [Didymella exigua CBS 183.55]|uniref:Uncharacterized protein n=1 Tax=Didymella exigua CBS 183.55 TaxID=1150837 RepID=A0A6A5R541_9PLEO|nr:uncharacterized protein M421DRAFT_77318 [Didymella exigua CBS 183.55]KAF1922763.1 hypothetical protein M421DRAFT_77318 [Didymella exigua CBS 183.55]